MDEVVNGMDDEGNGPESDAGDCPLPSRLRHGRQRPGQPVQRHRAQTIDEESCTRQQAHESRVVDPGQQVSHGDIFVTVRYIDLILEIK